MLIQVERHLCWGKRSNRGFYYTDIRKFWLRNAFEWYTMEYPKKIQVTRGTFHGSIKYPIYSNKRRGSYLIFRTTSAVLIWGRRIFKNCTRQIYFFYVQFLFNGTLSFYLLIFLWTDTKLKVNLELNSKNSGKRAYRPSREIQSAWTKEHHI